MSSSSSYSIPADPARVNVNDEEARRYWCQEFTCTETELLDAVRAVGELVADVRRYLLDRRY